MDNKDEEDEELEQNKEKYYDEAENREEEFANESIIF